MASSLETVLRRDRLVMGGALALLMGLAWLELLRLGGQMAAANASSISGMSGMNMSGMPMSGMENGAMGVALAPAMTPWSPADFLLLFVMWSVMMVGMMLPSAAPMILLYARVGRQAAKDNQPFAGSLWFAAGYLLSWSGFALAASLLQEILSRAAMLTPMASAGSARFGGVILVGVGLYQWTPFKQSCLAQCQSPLAFIQRRGGFRRDAAGALGLGLRHGAYCIGCCWALMALLFVGGVMNVLWIAAIAIFVLVEKLLPAGRLVPRLAGAALILAGLWMIFR